MAGSGVEIGRNVLILYNDSPSPPTVMSLWVGSSATSPSQWIVPGYYYPPRQFVVIFIRIQTSCNSLPLRQSKYVSNCLLDF